MIDDYDSQNPQYQQHLKLNFMHIYDGEIKLYMMCREYAENELQKQWTAVIILILFS